ncbi:MAG TPA: glycosyltransferase family A protein [Acidobacteriaceae bacterium]|nr:glycosyltransferase family A protein [Acidobacteriaceae bacterium]
MPQVSVVIPAYNCAAFLPQTLESVLAQTFTGWEIILVDDGSTDDTAAKIEPYLQHIRYIRQDNQGLPAARNRGIGEAQGEFIALLDGDDSWLPEKLEKQLPRFEDPEVGIVYSDFSVRYSDGRFQNSYLANRPLACEGNVVESYVRSRFLFPSTMVFRRACFDQCGGFDEEMLASEDIELFARMCLRWKVARVDLPLAIRYEGEHNITSNHAKMSRFTILALEKILKKEPDIAPSVRAVLHSELGLQHWWKGYDAFQRGDSREARRDLAQAIRYDSSRRWMGRSLIAASFLPAFLLRFLRGVKRGGGAAR